MRISDWSSDVCSSDLRSIESDLTVQVPRPILGTGGRMTRNTWDSKMSDDTSRENMGSSDLLRMTTEVVAAYLGNNTVPPLQISKVISTVHGALVGPSADSQRTRVVWGKGVSVGV